MNNYLECIEYMKDLYRASIGNAMLSNCTQLTKRYNNGEITYKELIELDRKNMTMRHELLKLVTGGLKEVTYVGSKEAASESSSRVSDCD